MVPGVAICPGGKSSMTVTNVTHETAMTPTGVDQRPKLNGPGSSLLRPDVMRKNMGVEYDV